MARIHGWSRETPTDGSRREWRAKKPPKPGHVSRRDVDGSSSGLIETNRQGVDGAKLLTQSGREAVRRAENTPSWRRTVFNHAIRGMATSLRRIPGLIF